MANMAMPPPRSAAAYPGSMILPTAVKNVAEPEAAIPMPMIR